MENRQEKKKTGKVFTLVIFVIISFIGFLPTVVAMCPLCTAGSIVGVGITRSFGLDDSIVGIFVGAMIVSTALWANNIFKRKNIGGSAFLRVTSIAVATFVLTFLGFYYAGIFGPANTYRIFGIEKILFGSISGSVVSFAAFFVSNKIKKRNNGKTLFNFQSMIFTFAGLVLNALIFWAVF